MIAHPNRSRSRLAQYGARLRTIDGRKTVEIINPNDNARARHQYRRAANGWLEYRRVPADGSCDADGSVWHIRTPREIAELAAQRGEYHPILDPLGLDNATVLDLLRGAE